LTLIHTPENAETALRSHRERVDSGTNQTHREIEATLWNGRKVWFEMSSSKLNLPGQPPLLLSIFRDITERKQAEAELDNLHQQLLGVSRQAGMAEVATNVLHNVGNVLNSVNTSVSVVAERLRDSQVGGVTRVTELLETHRNDLTGFLAAPGRADQVIKFLKTLSQHLASERALALAELQELAKNVDHIKEIVVMQQSYAKVSGVTERVKPTDLMEDALRMNVGALARHQVKLVREYAPGMPEILVEKHKVLQILVNLIRNAKYACDDSNLPDKCLTLRVTHDEAHVRIAVADNGVGIAPENLTRIFSHGFTTRKEGHGFGLHSGALAARELGGKLAVHSAGSGRGAEFTLELPLQPPGMAAPETVAQAELEPEEAHVLV
jgi:signal transduction histidine kinase